MSRATFTLFDDNRRIHQSALPESDINDLLAFSGLIDSEVNVEDVRTARTLWVCVGSRDGEVRVTITYLVAGAQSFLVSPGRPMVFETLPLTLDEIQSITIAPTSKAATVEILVYPGVEEEPPLVPLDAFLVLNAASGVEVTDGLVDSWQDTRPTSGAPGLFLPLQDKPTFIASHIPFNNQPSVFFRPEDTRLQSEDLAEVFEFLGTGPFTMGMVCLARDSGIEHQMASNEDMGSGGGFSAGIDGGFRTFHRLTDDAGVANNEATVPQELAQTGNILGDAIVYIIRYNGSRINVWRQGREVFTTDVGVSATSVAQQLILGGGPSGDGLLDGALADFRIWNREITTVERAGYISFAEEQYGVVNVEPAQAPQDAVFMLRANRGVTFDDGVSGEMSNWEDTRPETTFSAMGPAIGRSLPILAPLDPVLERPAASFTVDATLQYGGPAADFSIMAGDEGPWTALMVLVPDAAGVANGENLITMTEGVGSGTNVFLISQGGIYAEVWAGLDRIGFGDSGNMMDPGNSNVLFCGSPDDPIMETLFVIVQGRGQAESVIEALIGPTASGPVVQQLMIGARTFGDDSANVRIAEFRLYPRYLDTAEREQFTAYAGERYVVRQP